MDEVLAGIRYVVVVKKSWVNVFVHRCWMPCGLQLVAGISVDALQGDGPKQWVVVEMRVACAFGPIALRGICAHGGRYSKKYMVWYEVYVVLDSLNKSAACAVVMPCFVECWAFPDDM